MNLRRLKKHLLCATLPSLPLQNGSAGDFSPKPVSQPKPAHLRATWGPAVTPGAEAAEGGCAIGRWWEHQLPEQSTFGLRENCGAVAALPQQLPVTCMGALGHPSPPRPSSEVPSFYIQLCVPSPPSHWHFCLPGGKRAELSETHKPFIWTLFSAVLIKFSFLARPSTSNRAELGCGV